MAIILECSLPAGAFALEEVLEAVPSTVLELDQVVPTGTQALPFLWVESDDFDRFEELARAAPTVEKLALVESVRGKRLYAVQWGDDVEAVTGGIVETGGTVLGAAATDSSWEFTLRFPDRERAKAFQRHCIETGTPLDLSRLYDLSKGGLRKEYGLTEKQYATLLLAYEQGYFREPRGTDLAGLSGELDISPRAVSYRLRRGMESLVEHTITP